MSETIFRPVRVKAIHELVVDELRRVVEMWIYRPGDLLPSERELAEALGVSRNTLRTATAILESEGFISVKRGRNGGYRVEDPALGDDRGAEIRRNPQLVQRTWDYRIAVDVGAARLAAQLRDDQDLLVLDRLLDELDRAHQDFNHRETLENVRGVQALDSDFHVAIARSTQNPLVVDAVYDARRRLWIAFSSYLIRLDPASQHRRARIVEAIRSQDPDLAERVTREHLSAGRAQFETWLAEGAAVPALASHAG